MSTLEAVEVLAPQRLKMSYEEYLDFAGQSEIVEWVDGEAIVYIPPAYIHQDIVRFLSQLLDAYIRFLELGTVVLAPFEVKLWADGPSREPDIIFASNENRLRLTPQRFEGAPDLLIEIISPSSVTEDRVHKFRHYEQAGVREYWIIDPRRHQQQVDYYVLGEDNAYNPVPLDERGIYHSTVLPNFWFDASWLWQQELPNPHLILAEIMISISDPAPEAKETYQSLHKLLSK